DEVKDGVHTFASDTEAGVAVARSSTGAAEDAETADNAGASARALMRAIDLNLRPRDLLTREAFENAIALVMAIGGSTDAVLHLLAIAHAAEVPLSIDDFEAIRRKVPVLCDLKPAGRYMTTDFHRAGGVPQVLRLLLDHGLLHGDSRTISGRTLAETLAIIPGEPDPQQAVIRPWRDPVHSEGSVAVFRGNLAPGGAVAWIAGITSRSLTGPARIFDSEQAALAAILDHRIHAGDVIVIRGQGPQGGPGMCALMIVTSILVATGLGHQVGLITDGRVSSDPHSLVVGHITPEAAVGGPIALLQESDSITIDIDHQRLDVQLSEADLASRQAQWHQPAETAKPGAVLTKYAKLVSSASEGAVTR
ncbi:MAG TPA: dihydroxy-acid dehydratase, partial [Gammaproteobacteria bacterium]|nr:dihydroxy-acid dehydratase [Gammaproteobacteria bacterium]